MKFCKIIGMGIRKFSHFNKIKADVETPSVSALFFILKKSLEEKGGVHSCFIFRLYESSRKYIVIKFYIQNKISVNLEFLK